jgi:hypothetical protein
MRSVRAESRKTPHRVSQVISPAKRRRHSSFQETSLPRFLLSKPTLAVICNLPPPLPLAQARSCSAMASAEIPLAQDTWSASTVTEAHLRQMVTDGVLPEKTIIGWRVADGEDFLTPNTEEIVVFESFFYRGFGLPTSSFFRGLLHFYGIELIHLNPNSILQITTFIHFCEGFLGIQPHFDLFHSLFILKSYHMVAGGAEF